MPKWIKVLLAAVFSLGIFLGVTAVVYDQHFLGDDPSAQFRLDTCVEQSEQVGLATDQCFAAYGRDLDARYNNELMIGAACGAAATGLFWLLAWLLYFRRRRSPAQPA